MPLLSQFWPGTGTGLGRINQHFPKGASRKYSIVVVAVTGDVVCSRMLCALRTGRLFDR